MRRDLLAHRNLKVLVAEDNEVNQIVAHRLISGLGMEVRIAGDGKEAVEMSSEDRYDLIFMDCQMPVVDGFEATGLIRAGESEGVRIPIIAMTANASQSDREACLAAGMDDFLTKPVTESEIVATIGRVLKLDRA
ncbi:putative histidine kinase [Fimbriimonas ginsengisoli Gsoil 348]|uniref:Putative histidine kinase n=1 Tax=Fimbriimonas ginsengisoli Gsoil 348 TaxID=661478 RepID=A0A068NJR0_FIMGI|nr:putative histidine kinase [Fimbriimonas ginsengisoli Gsoil 348]